MKPTELSEVGQWLAIISNQINNLTTMGVIKQKKITISAAELKTAASSPLQVALSASKNIVPLSGYIEFRKGSAAFTSTQMNFVDSNGTNVLNANNITDPSLSANQNNYFIPIAAQSVYTDSVYITADTDSATGNGTATVYLTYSEETITP